MEPHIFLINNEYYYPIGYHIQIHNSNIWYLLFIKLAANLKICLFKVQNWIISHGNVADSII